MHTSNIKRKNIQACLIIKLYTLVMITVMGNRQSNLSSKSMKWFAFNITLIPLGKIDIQLFSLQLWVNSRAGLAL